MSIAFQVLGAAGQDNALLVTINSGQAIERLLFDCGEGCLAPMPLGELRDIDHLFFSHLHMDHISGFDAFFRALYSRTHKENVLWGPPATRRILHHRFQGYLWNLHHTWQATWHVRDIDEREIVSSRYELAEAFAVAHDAGSAPHDCLVLETPTYTIEALMLDHLTPSLAYIMHEQPHINVNVANLEPLGLRPAAWLKKVKNLNAPEQSLTIEGAEYTMTDLRRQLLEETPGDSIAYLTDFLLNDDAIARLVPALRGCQTVVCESQYQHADLDLAQRNYHLTSTQAAELARAAHIDHLIIFHVSDRYDTAQLTELLQEARAIFPNTDFPAEWQIG